MVKRQFLAYLHLEKTLKILAKIRTRYPFYGLFIPQIKFFVNFMQLILSSFHRGHHKLCPALARDNDEMQRAGLLELFEEATEIQEDFKHILELSNKNKRILTAKFAEKIAKTAPIANQATNQTQES
ncbi:hypothetical protein [Helicobacter felis]|uniref:hypothetical protein n=1 Tax=Helicobacter felis TaxID=214 RepID=UPI000CF152B6|nr:hypothetical protein [Helicobacter felis]